MTKNEKYLKKVYAVHGDRYGTLEINYIDSKAPITPICYIHGKFEKNPSEFLRDAGCKLCSNAAKKSAWPELKTEFEVQYNGQFDYDLSKYINMKTNIDIRCKKHNVVFQITPANHKNHGGCPSCRREGYGQHLKLSFPEFLQKARAVHGDLYDYNHDEYDGYVKPITITCKIHGPFRQLVKNHLAGSHCPECAKLHIGQANSLTDKEFKDRSGVVHVGKYSYPKPDYINLTIPVEIVCPIHGTFNQRPDNHLVGSGCSKCVSIESEFFEKEMKAFVDSLGISHTCTRKILPNYQELDIYVEATGHSIEANGIYWHSELQDKDENYHLNKTLECNKKGVKLVHVFEDEWKYKPDAVKVKLQTFLNVNLKTAHNLSLSELQQSTLNEFYKKYSLENYTDDDKFLGLYDDSNLIGIIIYEDTVEGIYVKDISLNDAYNMQPIVDFVNCYWSSVMWKEDLRWPLIDFSTYTIQKSVDPVTWYFKRSYIVRFPEEDLDYLIEDHFKQLPKDVALKLKGYYRIWDCGYKIYKK